MRTTRTLVVSQIVCISHPGDIELDVFCDGSLTAYGAVSYICIRSISSVHSYLIMSKTSQTPVNSNTLKAVLRNEPNAAKLVVSL